MLYLEGQIYLSGFGSSIENIKSGLKPGVKILLKFTMYTFIHSCLVSEYEYLRSERLWTGGCNLVNCSVNASAR